MPPMCLDLPHLEGAQLSTLRFIVPNSELRHHTKPAKAKLVLEPERCRSKGQLCCYPLRNLCKGSCEEHQDCEAWPNTFSHKVSYLGYCSENPTNIKEHTRKSILNKSNTTGGSVGRAFLILLGELQAEPKKKGAGRVRSCCEAVSVLVCCWWCRCWCLCVCCLVCLCAGRCIDAPFSMTTLPTKNFDFQPEANCQPAGHRNANLCRKSLLDTCLEHRLQQSL